jgi:hypothetical protein
MSEHILSDAEPTWCSQSVESVAEARVAFMPGRGRVCHYVLIFI